MTNEPYVIGGAMKDPVLQAIETAKWCDGAVLDPTIKTPTMTYIHGANKQIEAIRSAYIAERQRLEQRIAELELRLGCCRDASAGKDLLIAELEARNKEMMCAMREWYEDGFNRGDCGELIVKHGGEA